MHTDSSSRPSYPVKFAVGENWALIISPTGTVYRKFYDQHGGAGSMPVGAFGRWWYRKDIRQAINQSHAQ